MLKHGARELADAANARIQSWSPEEANRFLDDDETLFVDIRAA
jgi:hypothetical protein